MSNPNEATAVCHYKSPKHLHKGLSLRDVSNTQSIPLVHFPGEDKNPFVLLVSSKPDFWRRLAGSFSTFEEAFHHVDNFELNGFRVKIIERAPVAV